MIYKGNKDKDKKSVIIECECSTHYIQLTKYDFEDSLYVTFLEDKYYSEQKGIFKTIVTRIKLAWMMLRGKRYRTEEIIISKQDTTKLIDTLLKMKEEK